jgi:UDP-N-acetylglucosamine--N-acetylmuramyl-(pentapeptide) pyrophosphoryl-undecaprenol N-acetylglucosamine transferase
MNGRPLHIAIAGGGTGGHLFPGLAVAERLRYELPNVRLTWFGSGKPLERQETNAAKIDYLPMSVCRTPQSIKRVPDFLRKNIASFFEAKQFLKKEKVDLLLGLGGYVAYPASRAALWLGIPLVLLEQNGLPGRVNRLLAARAARVCSSFDMTAATLSAKATVCETGNPIRKTLVDASRHLKKYRQRRTLLVLGGSGGAEVLNRGLPKSLYPLRHEMADWQIVHQTGYVDCQATRELYSKLGIVARVEPFFESIAPVLRETALAICRSGGSTLAELAAFGVPAVLVPFPTAADDHQRINADYYARFCGAKVVDQRDSGPHFAAALTEKIGQFVADPLLGERISILMQNRSRGDAAEAVVREILAVVGLSGHSLARAS